MKHIFIVNPNAGAGNSAAAFASLLIKSGVDISYEIYETKSVGDATNYVRERCLADASPLRFYACGGDGTLNEVASGAAGFAQASVACYPCGSGNDFVKCYGGKDVFLDLDALIHGEDQAIDILRVGDRYAINACHFGLDTYVAKKMASVKHRPLIGGKNAYMTGVLCAVVNAMRTNATVYVDGEAINDGTMLLCTLANGQYVGGSFRCAPRAKTDDGQIEICLVRPLSRLRLLKLMNCYKKGEHLEDPAFRDLIVYRRASHVEIEGAKGFSVSLDGEIVEGERFSVDVMHHALRFVLPRGVSPVVKTLEPEEPAVL